VANAAGFGTQPRLEVTQGLMALETTQNFADDPRIGVELGDVTADVLVAPITQEVELGLVCPQDRAVWADPVQPDGCVFKKVS